MFHILPVWISVMSKYTSVSIVNIARYIFSTKNFFRNWRDLPLPPLPPNPEREAALKLREMREPWIIKPPPNPAPYPLFDPVQYETFLR